MTAKPTLQQEEAPVLRRHSLGYQVNHLARLLAQAIRLRIEPLGVGPGQLAQMLALYEEDGLTQTELCDRVRIDQSTMAHTLKRMERDGLVSRTRDPIDRRQVKVHLTPRAREIQDALVTAASQVNAQALQGMTRSDAERLLDTFSQLIAHLEADPTTSKTTAREEA